MAGHSQTFLHSVFWLDLSRTARPMTLFFHLLACGAAVAFIHPVPPLVTGPVPRIVGRTGVGRKQLPVRQRLGHLRMLGPDFDADSSMPDFRNAEYRREMRKRRAPQQPAAQPKLPPIIDLASAWVLLFNPGRHNEGVCALTLEASASSSVLAFESTGRGPHEWALLGLSGMSLRYLL